MRAVVQRVTEAAVTIDGETAGQIGEGLLVLLGVGKGDTQKDLQYLVGKILNLRIFEDGQGKMNCSLQEQGKSLLVVSQFTLYGDCRKGRRPSFDQSEEPEKAKQLYEEFTAYCRQQGIVVETGRFAADMKVHLVNDGPVTILLDSSKLL